MSKNKKYTEEHIAFVKNLVENGENLNKLELFARQKTEGWDVWGNEVESDISLNQAELDQDKTLNPYDVRVEPVDQDKK